MLYNLKSINSCVIGKKYNAGDDKDFPTKCFKYADYDYVFRNTTDLVRDIMSSAPLQHKHKYVVVDVKTHNLKCGEIPALPFWHVDCVNNPLNEDQEEFNHLYVSGDFCCTDFLKEEVAIDITDSVSPVNFEQYKHLFSSIKIPSNTIVTYRRHLHRATKATIDGTRLLVRITETDTIRPRNSEFKVTYTKGNK